MLCPYCYKYLLGEFTKKRWSTWNKMICLPSRAALDVTNWISDFLTVSTESLFSTPTELDFYFEFGH